MYPIAKINFMKQILFTLACVVGITGANMAQDKKAPAKKKPAAKTAPAAKPATPAAPAAASNENSAKPEFKWDKTSHNFGKIPQGTPVTVTFTFTNTGKSALIISNAAPSCGCTTPDWTKEPIGPGKKGFVKATYNAAAVGAFSKSVTITSNAGDAVILTLSGEVEASAPQSPVENH